jgi:hypothetical protein
MLDGAVLRLQGLNEDMAVFMGDAVEEREVPSPFGPITHKMTFPCLQLSKEMWDNFDRPTIITVSIEDRSHV